MLSILVVRGSGFLLSHDFVIYQTCHYIGCYELKYIHRKSLHSLHVQHISLYAEWYPERQQCVAMYVWLFCGCLRASRWMDNILSFESDDQILHTCTCCLYDMGSAGSLECGPLSPGYLCIPCHIKGCVSLAMFSCLPSWYMLNENSLIIYMPHLLNWYLSLKDLF